MVGKSREIFASDSLDSNTQIQRYIRLTNLIPEILDMVDDSALKETWKPQMALRPALELSYLPEVMESEDRTPSHAQAIKMRTFSEQGKLNPDVILSIMQEEKPNQVLSEENYRLRMENDYLKKLNALIQKREKPE